MAPDRAKTRAQPHVDDEARRKRLADPKVSARVREILERINRGDDPGAGVSVEELPDFLRDRG